MAWLPEDDRALRDSPDWESAQSLSEEDLDGAYDEKLGVNAEEKERWAGALAKMQGDWAACTAKAGRLQQAWERKTAEQDTRRNAKAWKDFKSENPAPSESVKDAWFNEEAACKRVAAAERLRWKNLAQRTYAEVALVLKRAAPRPGSRFRDAAPARPLPRPASPAAQRPPSSSSRGDAGDAAEPS